MNQLDPALVHQVLLADSEEIKSLQNPRSGQTLNFAEFKDCLDGSPSEEPDGHMIVKKAVRDHFTERLTREPADLAPLSGLLLELHQQMRALIPNRKDQHSVLNDNQAQEAHSLELLIPMIIKAASSLVQLEAESRATTTSNLIHGLKDTNDNSPSFWVTAVLYLLYKAELCQADKQTFFMEHVWVPKILKEGHALERRFYQERFGSFDDLDGSPATRQWIQSLIQSPSQDNPQGQESNGNSSTLSGLLLESKEERQKLIRKAWIEDIVFREAHQRSLRMPEIFALDTTSLQRIREVTSLAVAGCALVLHARTAAKSTPEQEQQEASESRKVALLRAMRSRHLPPTTYEEAVSEQVVALAQDWSSDTGVVDQASLRGRVIAVLRGEDPVLQLLNTRIKVAVSDVVVQKLHHKKEADAPTRLRTGLGNKQQQKDSAISAPQPTTSAIEKLFCQKGLAFFAPELASVAEKAGRIVDLAIETYWDNLLDASVVEQCNEIDAFALD